MKDEKKIKIFVHVYSTSAQVEEFFFDKIPEAKKFARQQFASLRNDVYKVKVWKNFSVPNVQEHENLLLHLV